MIIKYVTTVENLLWEDLVIDRAKHEFILNNRFVFNDWRNFRADEEYKLRCEWFYKRIRVTDVKPRVEVVNGLYKVTSVCVAMEYEL